MPAIVSRRPGAASVRRLRPAIVGAFALTGVLWFASHGMRAAGTVSLTDVDFPYLQTFDNTGADNLLASTGTANTTVPTGWEFAESGTDANTTYRAGNGSDGTGDTYSFGANGSSERAFGGLRSGTLVPLVGVQFTNNTGRTLTQLDVSYVGEQWRLGQNTTGQPAARLDFQLSTTATSLTTGTWIDHDALDFTSPVVAGAVGALDGNASSNRRGISASISGLAIAPGATFWVRWADTDLIPGADDGLAVDDFMLTPQSGAVVPAQPALSITDASVIEGNSGTRNAVFVVGLSAPAPSGGVMFDIATADGTALAGSDYVAKALAWQLIPAGSMGYTFSVPVIGDTAAEANETFFVNVTNIVGATPLDAQGTGTVTNDDVECGGTATLIHDVQGSGHASPMAGSAVTIEGVVVGDYQAAGQFGGYFVQEEDAEADADPATSEALFVFDSSTPANPGDRVRVTGTVLEFQSLTEIANVTQSIVCATGQSVAAMPVTLPVAAVTDLERHEGMLVTFAQPLTVTETFTLGRFGEVGLAADGRLWQPTQVAAPGATALAVTSLNARRRIVLDDGSGQQNVDPIRHPSGGLSASHTLRAGDLVDGPLTGVLDYRFGSYRVQPVGEIRFVGTNPRPTGPASVGGTLRVASFNLLNYFNGDGAGGGFPTARGADTLEEFERQRAKTIAALAAMDADIVGLMELENDAAGASAIEDLVAGLNAATATDAYGYVDTGIIGTDEIRVGLLFKRATVTPSGVHAVLTSAVDQRFDDARNRPTVAQTFLLNGNGAKLTVAVNHLRSRGADCNAVNDPDLGDGQGHCNVTRTKAAQALADWLATDPTGSQESDVLVIGDFNAYRNEDPIASLVAGGYADLVGSLVGQAYAYSYVFDGQAGYLDHALASASLAPQVTGVTEWHIAADEPVALDYNVEFKSAGQVASLYAPTPYRAGDHDPIVIGIDLTAPYDFEGFDRPVSGGSTVTEAKAGSAVPIKFSLGGDQGLDVLAPGSPSSVPITCTEGATHLVAEVADSAGQSTLQYDPVRDLYTFVWKTDKAWSGTCRRLTVKLTDGTWHRTDFSFR